MLRRALGLALLSALSLRPWALDVPKTTQPKQASFHIDNIFTVKVPKGAKTVRVWFAVPQSADWTRQFTTKNWGIENK